MIIEAKVKASARENKIVAVGPNVFEIRVTAIAEKGKANEAVCRLVAEYFGVPPSTVFIISGKTSTHKLIEVAWTK